MLFNLNEFLMSISFALDFIEMDILGVRSNHSKRTAYISLMLGEKLGFSKEQLHDITALGILHDNGVSARSLHNKFIDGNLEGIRSLEIIKEHCIIGEENAIQYPFLTDVKDVIKYHHENYNGTSFFNLKGNEIPLMSQIIHLADIIDVTFDLENNNFQMQKEILKFVKKEKNKMFSPKIVDPFCDVAKSKDFWRNLGSHSIDMALKKNIPQCSMNLTFQEIRKITGVLSKIIDSKSRYTEKHSRELSNKASIMADFYKMNIDEKFKLLIAADLHDIGKLAVPNAILDSTNKLSKEEFEIIKKHPYYTRLALQEIKGFEDITEWAANHHEKLNGQGYPFGKTAKDLDFNSRLMACLDIYQALTEERPYRIALNHGEAMNILTSMKNDGLIDSKITDDIDYVFGNLKM